MTKLFNKAKAIVLKIDDFREEKLEDFIANEILAKLDNSKKDRWAWKVSHSNRNKNCKYAAHTGGGNTGAIGIALCGMYGFTSAAKIGSYPITKVQCEALFCFVAKLAKKYGIKIDSDHIMTHYEFGLKQS